MIHSPRVLFALAFGGALALSATACSEKQAEFQPKGPAPIAAKKSDKPIDDHALCDWKNKPDRESTETTGVGASSPNVRRVFQLVGTGEDRHKVLICREVDTNLDGIKDVVRFYNEKGESTREEADTNYDGKIDTRISFSKGHITEVELDTDFDGKFDEWKSYSGGKLSRIKRSTNHDAKVDRWEIYRDGQLERIGVDLDGDGRVDRWDHDTEQRRKLEDADRKKDEEAAAKDRDKQEAAQKEAAKDADAADAADAAKPEGATDAAKPEGGKADATKPATTKTDAAKAHPAKPKKK